jgi:hypothetical protein
VAQVNGGYGCFCSSTAVALPFTVAVIPSPPRNSMHVRRASYPDYAPLIRE